MEGAHAFLETCAEQFQTGPRPRAGPSVVGATQGRISASTPDVPQGRAGSHVKDIAGGNSCVATLCSSQIPRSDTSVISSKSQRLVFRLLPQLHPPPPSRPSSFCPSQFAGSYRSKLRHVRPRRDSVPLSKQGRRNNYKKINTGMTCHLVSRPANTPLGNVPVPPVH